MLCYAAPAPPTLWQRPSCARQPPPHHSPSLPGRGPRDRFARPPAQRGDHRGASASQPTHTPPLHMVERGPGGEDRGVRPTAPQAVVFPPPPPICPTVGKWQMQDYPGAPGTARQGSTRTIVSTNRGGKATQPRAPGHERPLTAQRAARHGRLSAATRAPGADVPLATTARAPGQHCLSAAPRAPGHERPLAAQRAAGHDRLSAALRAPGADVPLATTARAPGQHRLSAAPIATAPVPAGLRRLRQVILPRTPATPNTLTYLHSLQITANLQALVYPQTHPRPAAGHHADSPSLAGKGPGVRSTSLQVHSAIQVPPRPRSCSTACTGFLRQHPSRAPPAPCASLRRKPQSSRTNE